jgi:hypothetical protein
MKDKSIKAKKWILRKYVTTAVYFKYKDRSGHTNTSNIKDSMKFDTKLQAIDFNYDFLNGDYEVIPYYTNI